MVARKASLASSLTWKVALIHSSSESSSVMYHFQSCTSQIQPCNFFEVSQVPTLLLPIYVPSPHVVGPGLLGQEASHGLPQKLPSLPWSRADSQPCSTVLEPPVLLGMATLPLVEQ